MTLPDINIWVALTFSLHSHHQKAAGWLGGITAAEEIVFCRATQQGLLRMLCNPVLLKTYGVQPSTNEQAWQKYEAFLSDPRITFAHEPHDLEETWKSLALRKTASPKLWMDAYLAAFAICSGFQLVSADKAFSQFKGLDFHLIENT